MIFFFYGVIIIHLLRVRTFTTFLSDYVQVFWERNDDRNDDRLLISYSLWV